MNSRSGQQICIALLFVFTLLTSTICVSADVRHISADGELSLQEVLDTAESGTTVALAPGQYKGPITIQKNLSVVTEASLTSHSQPNRDSPFTAGLTERVEITGGIVIRTDSAFIQGIFVIPDEETLNLGIRVELGNVSIVGCSVFDPSEYGILCGQGTQVSGSSLDILGSAGVGIYVEGSASCVLQDCIVMVSGSSGIECLGMLIASDTILIGNGRSVPWGAIDDGHGLRLSEGGTAWLEKCLIHQNRGYGISYPLSRDEYEDSCRTVKGRENVIPPYGCEANRAGMTSFDRSAVPHDFFAKYWNYAPSFCWVYDEQQFRLEKEWSVPFDEVINDGKLVLQLMALRVESVDSKAILDDLVADLLSIAADAGITEDWAIAEFIGNFVGSNISYDKNKRDDKKLGTNAPLKTLVQELGVCRDTSVLLASLLIRSGLDAILVSLPDIDDEGDGHMVVGIHVEEASGSYASLDGIPYFLLESTAADSKLGGVPLEDWGKPVSHPAITGTEPNIDLRIEWVGAISHPIRSDQRLIILRITLTNDGPLETPAMHINACDLYRSDDPWDAMRGYWSDSWIPSLQPSESHTVQIGLRVPVEQSHILLHVAGCDDEEHQVFRELVGRIELRT